MRHDRLKSTRRQTLNTVIPMMDEKVRNLAQPIRLAVFDVDGVFTNGELIIGADGEVAKIFHAHDGMGIKRLMAAGIHIAIITARQSAIVDTRMRELGVTDVFQGQHDKSAAMQQLLSAHHYTTEQIAYTGDDLPDLAAMQHAGFKIAVANATAPVKHVADFVTAQAGGHGAVREISDLILQAQDHAAR